MVGPHRGEGVEEVDWVMIRGGDAHQTAQLFAEARNAGADEDVGFGGGDAGFLGFVADIDLDQEVGDAADALGRRLDGIGEAWPVKGFDGVGGTDGVGGLVGLQRADEVEAEIWMVRSERREFGGGLLDAIFAKNGLAGLEGGGNGFGGVRLADGDEGDVGWGAASAGGGRGDAGVDAGEGRGDRVGFGHG